MPTTNFIRAQRSQFSQGTTEQSRCTLSRLQTAKHRSDIEPEQRLWKLSLDTASLKSGKFELLAILFFGVLVSAAIVNSLSELVHLLNSGAFEQTVQALLKR